MQVIAAVSANRRDWETLWRDNCAHFGASGMTDMVVEGLWDRILDLQYPINAWLAAEDRNYVGLAHTILHPHTFTLRPVCYLEDLWVTPLARGKGVATQIINHLSEVGREQGWRRLYWETGIDNERAQMLYERIAIRSPTFTYKINLNE